MRRRARGSDLIANVRRPVRFSSAQALCLFGSTLGTGLSAPRARTTSTFKSRRFTINVRFREHRQFLVRRFLLVEVLLQNGSGIGPPKLLGPRDQGAVASNFIVLYRLRRGDQGGIQHGWIIRLAS